MKSLRIIKRLLSFTVLSVCVCALVALSCLSLGCQNDTLNTDTPCNVTVYLEEGVTGVAPTFENIKIGDVVLMPENTLSKYGYTFGGWSDGNNVYQPGDSYTVANSDVVFSDVWNKTLLSVTFIGGEEISGTAPKIDNAEVGTTLVLPESSLSKDGYVFGGWSDGSKTYQPGDSYVLVDSNVTFNAVWISNTSSITFIIGDGAVGTAPTLSDMQNGDTVSIPKSTLTKEGYALFGWSDGVATYQAGDKYTVDSNVTFTAVWLPYTEGLEFQLSEDKTFYCFIGTGTSTDTIIVIPPTYNGLPVKEIYSSFSRSNSANSYKKVETVYIPNSITTIKYNAFLDWKELSTVIFESDSRLTAIEDGAFRTGDKLKSIRIPSGVQSIGDRAFMSCGGLTNVYFEENSQLTSIGEMAFIDCRNLESIEIPLGVTEIKHNTFESCCNLTNVTIPNSVTTICNWAFADCCKLPRIFIPSSVTKIDKKAFLFCPSIDSIEVATENPIYHSDDNCIIETTKKTIILGCASSVIPDDESVTSIGDYAFASNPNLSSIVIPKNIIDIGENTFSCCINLTELTILSTQININDYAFDGCFKLVHITNLCNSSNVVLYKDFAPGDVCLTDEFVTSGVYETRHDTDTPFINTLTVDESGVTTYVVGNKTYLLGYVGNNLDLNLGNYYNITDIIPAAFVNSLTINSIVFPPNITKISAGICIGCSSLTSVKILGAVTQIEDYAFTSCDTLKNILIPDSITYIGKQIFEYTEILSYNEKDNVKYLGNENNPYLVAFGLVDNSATTVTIYETCKVIYEGAFMDCNNFTSICIPKGVSCIGSSVLTRCSKLASITVAEENSNYYGVGNCLIERENQKLIAGTYNSVIPEGVKSIEDGAFYDNKELTTITIPSTVTTIEDNAFYGCENLKNVIFEENSLITYIGKYAFNECFALAEIAIPDSVAKIDDYAFYNCTSLQTIVFDDNGLLSDIGSYAFYHSEKLSSISIPSNVKSIGYLAFSHYANLVSITVANGNTAYYSANNCLMETASKRLILGCASSVIPEETTKIATSAFYNCLGLKSITIPSNVTIIEKDAFSHCCFLSSVIFEDGSLLTTIGTSAFESCFSLVCFEVQENVSRIGDYAFSSCNGIVEIINLSQLNIVAGSNEYGNIASYAKNVCSSKEDRKTIIENGYISYKDGDDIILMRYFGTDSALVLPEKTTTIDSYFLSRANGLSFSYFNVANEIIKIRSVVIPSSVISIMYDAFEGCYNLLEVYNLSSLAIRAGSSEYGFVAYYAKAVYTENHSSSFVDDGNGCEIYDDGTNVILIKYYGQDSQVTLPDNLTKINPYAFYNNHNLTSVSIPASVTEIGRNAFESCVNLQTVTFGANSKLITISRSAFINCSALSNITLPERLETISYEAFMNSGLTTINIPTSVTIMEAYTFKGCENLQSVTFAENCKLSAINPSTFYNCISLLAIEIPSSATIIGSEAFYGCYSLVTVSFEEGTSLLSIGQDVFYDCNSLTFNVYKKIKYLGTVSNPYLFAICPCDYTVTEIDIHDNCIIMASRAFQNCKNLVTVSIPSDFYGIESGYFIGCDNLVLNEYQNILYLGNSENPYLIAYDVKDQENDYLIISKTCTTITNTVCSLGNSRNKLFYEGTASDGYSVKHLPYEYSFEEVILYFYSETDATNCWHYVDNVPTEWHPEKEMRNYDGFTYKLKANGFCEIMSYVGSENIITIPAEIDGYPVKSINDYAFKNSYTVIDITVSEGIEDIGEAMRFAPNLLSLTLPATVSASLLSVITPKLMYFTYFNEDLCNKIILDYNTYCVDIMHKYRYIEAGTDAQTAFTNDINVDSNGIITLTVDNTVFLVGYVGNTKILDLSTYSNIQAVLHFALYKSDLESIVLPSSITKMGSTVFDSENAKNVYYYGTESDWNKIIFDSCGQLDSIGNARVYFYSETEADGAWHYVDGSPDIR